MQGPATIWYQASKATAAACARARPVDVYVPPEWAKRCGEPDELEVNILDFAFDVKPESRLSCQIGISDDLDGLIVHLPVRQY